MPSRETAIQTLETLPFVLCEDANVIGLKKKKNRTGLNTAMLTQHPSLSQEDQEFKVIFVRRQVQGQPELCDTLSKQQLDNS